MPETDGFGTESCFFAANEELSIFEKKNTSSTTCKFAINIH
jgi:hypothetical protein